MATINIAGSNLGTPLQELLLCDAIVPGTEPSYQICKTIYLYHTVGAKMAEAPIVMAQSQARNITVSGGPEELLVEAFNDEWLSIGADRHIKNVHTLSRVYGIATLAVGSTNRSTDDTFSPEEYADKGLYFSVFDPLNTSGSLVLNQQPNSPDFQKVTVVSVQGQKYHPSRTVVVMNEEPVYIAYTSSAFGYVGRSCYQRALFPLKSFVQTMIADDMISLKTGLIVAKMKSPGPIWDQFSSALYGIKRNFIKEGQTYNVLSIDVEEAIETLNMQNAEGPGRFARENILKNIATSADMPAVLLENETLTEGFGEGTEDAKNIARYIEGFRVKMKPTYEFFDAIVMRRAWNEDFYATIQEKFPEQYGSIPYESAFMRWSDSFIPSWPSLLIEPDSERAKAEDVKLKDIIATLEVMMPQLDPDNKAIVLQWAADNMSENKALFKYPLILDMGAYRAFDPVEAARKMAEATGGSADDKGPSEPRPFSSGS